jgi:hypothetical protein
VDDIRSEKEKLRRTMKDARAHVKERRQQTALVEEKLFFKRSFERQTVSIGLYVLWDGDRSGLYPTKSKKGRSYRLPA